MSEFKVGDRCKVVNSLHIKQIGQVVTIHKVEVGYYHAKCQDRPNYPFIQTELELFPVTKLEKALK